MKRRLTFIEAKAIAKKKHLTVTTKCEYKTLYDIPGTFIELRDAVMEFCKEHKFKLEQVEFTIDFHDFSFELEASRPYTEKEVIARVELCLGQFERERENRQLRAEEMKVEKGLKDIKEYARLKKKYKGK